MALCCAGMLLLPDTPAHAVVEVTPWGAFDFPPTIRTQREAQAHHAEAKAPIVVAIRFLGSTDSPQAPWINRHLACGSNGTVRQDLAQAMVRTSTRLAHRLAIELERGQQAAADLRAGRQAEGPVRYAGPLMIVLEPMQISVDGEALPPPVVVEPHLRVFLSASVPRCAKEATGAFGRRGELSGGFMITATPSLELGWPTSSAAALGQRVVMATEDELADGFCCGQEYTFGLESLVSVYDLRDYQTKARLKATMRTLATTTRRGATWASRVRDAFGLPERYPERNLLGLQYGTGGQVANELVIWPAVSEPLVAPEPPPAQAGKKVVSATLGDLVLGLAWYGHSRADLISPALLEAYDPERKYSFVGWPEEFREVPAVPDTETFDDPNAAPAANRVLEVFGTDRKFSFVGQPDAIAENIAFAFAGWRAEFDFLDRHVTRPFLDRYAADSPASRAFDTIATAEMAATRHEAKKFQPVFAGNSDVATGIASYMNAIREIDSPLRLPGLATSGGTATPAFSSGSRTTLSWAGKNAEIPSASAEQLRNGLRRLYRETFVGQLQGLAENP